MTTNTAPEYKTSGDPEIDSNPLLAHLPGEPETEKECYSRLLLKLHFKEEERFASKALRRRRIRQLNRFFVPIDPTYCRALTTISTNFYESAIHRNPMTAEGQAQLHGRGSHTTFKPGICLISGRSGMGKSTLVDRVLSSLGNHVTRHSCFQGVPFPETQILYLRRNIPPNCTPARLARTFGTYVDKLVEAPMYAEAFRALRTVGGGQDVYLAAIDRITSAHHVGAIVLDEIQNLLGSGAQRERVIELLVNLREEGGLPIILVGTPKALKLLEGDFAPARRLAEGGYFELARATEWEDPIFYGTCRQAWQYQWLKEPKQFSEEICKTLYLYSQGINGVMLTLLQNAQLLALDEDLETVDEALIKRAFEERMKPLHAAIRGMQGGDPKLHDEWDAKAASFWPKERQQRDPAEAEDIPISIEGSIDSDSETLTPPRKPKPQKSTPIVSLTPAQLRAQVVDPSSMRNVMSILNG